jgi:hypothetical protein
MLESLNNDTDCIVFVLVLAYMQMPVLAVVSFVVLELGLRCSNHG